MKWFGIVLVSLVALVGSSACVYSWWINPRVVEELRNEPTGERAQKVMLLTLPSGKELPVNYLREGDTVYVGADGPWWREMRGEGARGSVFILGETYEGHMRAVEDDPEFRERVFAKLRPNALSFAGTLVVIELDR